MLHGLAYSYGMPWWTQRGASLGRVTRRPLGRLGACGDQTYDPSTGITTIDTANCSADSTLNPIVNVAGSGSSGAPFNWSGLLSNLTGDFTSIYKAVQPTGSGCTQYTGPGGVSYVSCPQPGQASAGLPSFLSGGFSGSSSTLWLLLAVGLGAAVLFSRK
jgi:hypothetical protein